MKLKVLEPFSADIGQGITRQFDIELAMFPAKDKYLFIQQSARMVFATRYKDMNGKDIFEGDVCQFPDSDIKYIVRKHPTLMGYVFMLKDTVQFFDPARIYVTEHPNTILFGYNDEDIWPEMNYVEPVIEDNIDEIHTPTLFDDIMQIQKIQ